MTTTSIIYTLAIIALIGFIVSRQKANRLRQNKKIHSLPRYYGYYTALWAGVPSLLLLLLWLAIEPGFINNALIERLPESMQGENVSLVLNNIKLAASNISAESSPEIVALADYYTYAVQISSKLKMVLVLVLAVVGAVLGFYKVGPRFRARLKVERSVSYGLLFCSFVAIITTVGIVASVLVESIHFFGEVPIGDFLFGLHWSPTATDPSFGAIPLFLGTLLISLIALLIAVPIGLMAAIYLSEYASKRIRAFAKPVLELLAGIPTVVYGFFAVLTIAPAIRGFGESFGLSVSSESALAAGLVMGVMIIPFVSSLSDDVISAVPQQLRDGSLGLGATRSETIKQVVLPAALPGVVSGILLAASRAIGETMIVVMAAGLSANLTANPLQAVTTVTVQIVTLLTGDQEFDSAKTLAAFALALLLFFVTLLLNVVALRVVKKYREQYD